MLDMTRLTIALALSALGACAADAAPEPEPKLEMPGSFVAFDEGEGHLKLVRTLDVLYLENATILFATIYKGAPLTWEAATELAKDHDLAVQKDLEFYPLEYVTEKPHQVVWFRTLTDEEEARIP